MLRVPVALGISALIYLYVVDILVYWETRLLSAFLWVLGLDHVAGSHYVTLLENPKTFIVSVECSGVVSMSVFLTLMVALWGTHTLRHLAVGLMTLFTINMARILGAVLGYLIYGDAGLWTAHYVVGPVALYMAILFMVTAHVRAQIRTNAMPA